MKTIMALLAILGVAFVIGCSPETPPKKTDTSTPQKAGTSTARTTTTVIHRIPEASLDRPLEGRGTTTTTVTNGTATTTTVTK